MSNETVKDDDRNPSPAAVVELRGRVQVSRSCGITEAQTVCADWVSSGLRSWQQWERGDRKMHPAFWELVSLKASRYLRRRLKDQ
jgi:hypothetical protein